MSWFESVSPKAPPSDSAKPFDAAAMAQLGAMSPLWMLFFSASATGMAYWGMTRWMRLAAPERIAENVVKLRLVKSAPPPKPVESAPAIEAIVPEPVAPPESVMVEPEVIEPVVAEVASVSVVMPEPVAQAAAVVAPDLVKAPPKPKAAKPKLLKPIAAPVGVEPPPAPKIPARRGRPPKVQPLKVDLAPAPITEPAAKAKSPVVKAARVKAAPKTEPVAKVKAPGAKRGPKPKLKA